VAGAWLRRTWGRAVHRVGCAWKTARPTRSLEGVAATEQGKAHSGLRKVHLLHLPRERLSLLSPGQCLLAGGVRLSAAGSASDSTRYIWRRE
jgi:hypothetical protein